MSLRTQFRSEPQVDEGEFSAAAQAACLRIDPATRRQALSRLRSAKGHLEGVLRMLENPHTSCTDALKYRD